MQVKMQTEDLKSAHDMLIGEKVQKLPPMLLAEKKTLVIFSIFFEFCA